MKLIITFLIVLFFTHSVLAIDTTANEAIVYDWNTNEILFSKNSVHKSIPASMTKIMTVYVVFDRIKNTNLSINDECTVSPKAYKMGGSRTFIEIDEKVTISVLLRGIIIQSGNDASVAIAECLSGTEDDFAKLMNVYASKLNMSNSNFTNASGWPEDNHYSTVNDIAILSNALIRDFPDLYHYFSEKEFTHNKIKQPNRNRLLNTVPGVDGLKTGYTKKSGWGIAASSIINDRRITVVINGTNSSRQRLLESEKLIKLGFQRNHTKKNLKKRPTY